MLQCTFVQKVIRLSNNNVISSQISHTNINTTKEGLKYRKGSAFLTLAQHFRFLLSFTLQDGYMMQFAVAAIYISFHD